jgi:hypothetical protein
MHSLKNFQRKAQIGFPSFLYRHNTLNKQAAKIKTQANMVILDNRVSCEGYARCPLIISQDGQSLRLPNGAKGEARIA